MNNIEDKIKKEFQQQEIQPSKNSWESLSQMLDTKEVKKSKKGIIFFKYAAVFIGLLIAISFFLQNKNTVKNIDKNDIVNTHKTTIDNQEIIVVKTDDKTILNTVLNKNETTRIRTEKNINTHKKPVKTIKKTHKNTSLLAVNKITTSNPLKSSVQKIISNDVVINPIAVVQDKQNHTDSESIKIKHPKELMNSSDDDIETMLAMALKKIPKERNQNITVNTQHLQKKVETELYKNTNTKYKIYKVIKAGVDTVETFIVSNDNK